jgi:membrane-associated protease RseP (regulator of RpoE activity)
MRQLFFGIAIVVSSSLLSTSAHAELPPGAYEELLKEAQEVLDVRITKVTQTNESNANEIHFICDAIVQGVERSKTGMKRGDAIQFVSYIVTEAAQRQGWAGPKVPPRLSVGQTWKVSLNAAMESGKPFELAAYGRSFQSTGTLPAPNSSPDRLGVMAGPAPGGGLQIVSVNRRSIADKLGLRPGDRVLDINGAPVNSIAEVSPAIAQNQERVEIKFVRDGETIELTLKR